MQVSLFLALAIVGEVVGTSALKASQGFTQLLPSIVAIVGYCIDFYFLLLTLRTFSVGLAYANWSGARIVLVSAVGWALSGLILITAGILIATLLQRPTLPRWYLDRSPAFLQWATPHVGSDAHDL